MKIVETPHILVISNDEAFHAFLKYHFDDCYELHCIESIDKAMKLVSKLQPATIIASSKVGDNQTGVDVLAKTREISPKSNRILMTDDNTTTDFEKAINLANVFRVVSLPFEVDKISRILDESTLAYAERIEREQEIERLTRTSQQLEFQLRQSLIG